MWIWFQALNFASKGAQQLSSDKGHFYGENVSCIGTLQRPPQQKRQGTKAIAVGTLVYFEPRFSK